MMDFISAFWLSLTTVLSYSAQQTTLEKNGPQNMHILCIYIKEYYYKLTLSMSLILLLPVVVIAAEAAETEALNRFGGEKFTAQWHPLCRWRSHFPREFHAFSSLLYRFSCLKFSHSQGQYNGCNLM